MWIVVMGVAGAGKTAVGRRLAALWGMPFYDADDFHSAAAIAKMERGEPLDDTDRAPWLDRLAALTEESPRDTGAVLAVSALKERYRARLRDAVTGHGQRFCLVYLRVTPETADLRVRQRPGHFMPASLIASQFAALEEPSGAVIIDAGQPLEAVIAGLVDQLAGDP